MQTDELNKIVYIYFSVYHPPLLGIKIHLENKKRMNQKKQPDPIALNQKISDPIRIQMILSPQYHK